jgi:hypothetical protein
MDEGVFALAAALGTVALLECLLWYPWFEELLGPRDRFGSTE